MMVQLSHNIQILGDLSPQFEKILTADALQFLAKLHTQFNSKRLALLEEREKRQQRLNQGELPTFLSSTAAIRQDSHWKVTATPEDLTDRLVEITGPVERKMMINALNSGASVFMADFEDALTPTWKNVVEGQINLNDAINRTISFESPEGKKYTLKEKIATLMIRPRGWHLHEKHVLVEREMMSASLFDAGLYLFHQTHKLIKKKSAPYFYLPKLESHLEARLWNEVFIYAQDLLGIPHGTIRATVLIETILAAFEMEEILYELKDHSCGLNAGRWDYIFSIIKKFQEHKDLVFPDRGQITMRVPFMKAYAELLVKTCHKRNAYAIGGMAAFIPSRKNKEINEQALAKVQEDKLLECQEGFDGTWVAHPDLVGVAKEVFETTFQGKTSQLDQTRKDNTNDQKQLLNFTIPHGKITEQGLRQNIRVALLYLESWLKGVAAVAIDNLMEDTATCEISRAQLWQWLHHPNGKLDDARKVTKELFENLMEEEATKIPETKELVQAKKILKTLVLTKPFIDFLTVDTYKGL